MDKGPVMEVGHNHNGTSTMGLIIRSLELLILRGQGEMVPVMSTRRTCGLIYKSLRDVAEGKRKEIRNVVYLWPTLYSSFFHLNILGTGLLTELFIVNWWTMPVAILVVRDGSVSVPCSCPETRGETKGV